MLRVTEIDEINELLELRDEWNDVLERSRDKHIFLTWEWQSTYWKYFGKERKLRVLCITDKNKIIAIAPLRESRYSFANSFGYTVIEPLGYRGGAAHGADYTGLILPEREAKCLKLFLSYLIEHDDWDFIYLYDIPGTSIIPELLPKVSEDIPAFELTEGVICPYISIPDSMDTFMKGLSKKFRSNLRRRMRNLEKDYQKVELKRYDEFGSVEEAVKIFIELHQKRLKSMGMPGEFATQKLRDFYLEVAERFASNGWLALHFLTANDEPIAADYSYQYKQKMYTALDGLDPDYSRYSPMHLLTFRLIEKCIEKGIKEYDLLKGDEPYKFDYTSKYRRTSSIRLVNNSFISCLYDWGIRIMKQAGIQKIIGKFLSF